MCRVFINYRTGDEEVCAALVDRELSAAFGDDNVFRASKSIPPGAQFEDGLLRNVWRSDVLVAVIGKRWLTATDARGERALDNPGDWTRREITEALNHQVVVIPLLVNGAERLLRSALPDDLVPLATRQYQRLDVREVDAGLGRLVARLREVCGGKPDRSAGRPDPEQAATGRRGGIGSITGRDVQAVTDPSGPVNMGSGQQFVGDQGDGATFVFGGHNEARQKFTRRARDES
ncbi:toll/interleukin-1 receptor domain-containing protein [Actinosynnema sp. NPDC050436]|uniref:toll/interleukin-1 receptor domain-containing protein n=1 Tax=Actinosynnema sp. NPDC050436 TaxID=3155659 RepID=UPI0033C88E35